MMTNEERVKHAAKVAELLMKHPQLQSLIAPISGVNVPYDNDTQKIKASLGKMNIPSIEFTKKQSVNFDL